jgi:subtilisin family serine protease
MGTEVGDDGMGNQIGMAPGAKWIACRNMDNGDGQPSTYAECFEFFIAPYPIGGNPMDGDPSLSPDAINNSWGCPIAEGCLANDPNVLRSVVESTRAAGIMVVASAGNSGPACSTVNTPIAIYDASYSVGAVSSSDTIASFSSRGPVTFDGSNRLKPDISAPGVSVRSSVPVNGYAFFSGTSMAGPHIAGAVALLWSAHPELVGDTDLTEQIINRSAFPRLNNVNCGEGLNVIPNNTYGYGRLDILAAVNQTPTGHPIVTGKAAGGGPDKVRRFIKF